MTNSFEPSDVFIPAADGLPLAGHVFEPRVARFTILMLPGIGVPQRIFRRFAAWMAARGVRVVTFDYRGVGESARDDETLRTASLTNWARRDAVGALRFAERSSEGGAVVLVGHSFGGQVVGFSDEFRRASAAVFIASQFGRAAHWDGFGRWKVAAYWNLILPLSAAVFDVVPGWTGIGEPIPGGVAREWARWGRSADWLVSHVPRAPTCYAAFDRPVRAYAVTDDDIAPSRAVADFLSRFEAATIERVDLSPSDLGLAKIGHLGLFRPGATERVWREIFEFAARHAESRAERRRASG